MRLSDSEVRQAVASLFSGACDAALDESEPLSPEWLDSGVAVVLYQSELVRPTDGQSVPAAAIAFVASDEAKIEEICKVFRERFGLG